MIAELRAHKKEINKIFIILYSIGIFTIVNILMIYVFMYNFRSNIIEETKINIYEYEEIDMSHICQMFGCNYIQNNSVLYKNIYSGNKGEPVRLVRSDSNIISKMPIFDNMSITSDFDVLVEIQIQNLEIDQNYNGFVVIAKKNILDIINNIYYFLLVFIISFNLILLLYNFLKYRQFRYKENIMLQHEGYFKSMMLLTENIHHELNTPLSVVNNKFLKLKNKNETYCALVGKSSECISDSEHDFEMIQAALNQVSDLLNRMRPFKDVKRQNNRCLKTVIKTSCDILLVSQHEKFDYEIFAGFEDYKLNGEFLKNGELTAILLNFIKNSIDANATDIQFKIKEKKGSKLSFFIIDNGNGIPKEFRDKVFTENSSSKGTSRGHGLFVNKFIINSSGGDIKLVHTSESGTIFEITVEIIQNLENK